jgi:hypothetical protein
MGVGPTYGTVAGDPTQNLGGLGPQLQQQLLNSMDQRQRHDNINNDDGAAGTRSSAGGMLSEGDADVRGRKGISVHEDADMGLRQQGAAAVAAGSTGGGSRALSGVEGGVMAGGDEYSPEGLDVLDAGTCKAHLFCKETTINTWNTDRVGNVLQNVQQCCGCFLQGLDVLHFCESSMLCQQHIMMKMIKCMLAICELRPCQSSQLLF